jgi:PAS domain S-box-containing protein
MRRPAQNRLFEIIDQYHQAVLLVDKENAIIFMNQAGASLLKSDSRYRIGEPFLFKLNGNHSFRGNISVDGKLSPVEFSADEFEWNGLGCSLVSIKPDAATASIPRTDEPLDFFKTIADYTYDWEYFLLPDQRLSYVSPSCKRITGYDVENFLNSPELMIKIVHPGDRARFINHLDRTLRQKKLTSIEFRILDRKGKVRWIGQKSQPVFLKNGEYLGCRSSNREITDIKLAQIKLNESLRKLRGFIAHSGDGVFLVNSQGLICEWNSMQEKISGIPKPEVMGQPFLEIRKLINYSSLNENFPVDFTENSIQKILKTGKGKLENNTFEWVIKSENGSERFIQEHYFTIKSGMKYQLGCLSRDITGIKRSSLDLEMIAEKRTQQLLDEVQIRQQAEIELTKHLKIEHCLSKISRILIQNVNLKETIPLVLRRLALVSDADRVSLFVCNKMGAEIEAIYEWKTTTGASRRIHPDLLYIDNLFSFNINDLRTGKIVDGSDHAFCIGTQSEIDPQKMDPDVKFSFLVPVISVQEFLGIIRFDFGELKRSSVKEGEHFLEIMSQIIGGALERGRMLDALERQIEDRTQDIHILHKIASLVNKPTGVNDILKSSLDILMDSPIHIGAGFIHFQGNENQEDTLVYYKNVPEESTRWIRPIFKSDILREKLISTMRIILIPDLRQQSDIPLEICMDRYFSYIGIPIWVQGRLMGLLSLMGENFDELTLDNITLLSAVGDQIGSAIEGEYLRIRAKEAAVIEERQRLARDLHDSVTQYLYSLVLLIKGWRRDVDKAQSTDEIKDWFGQANEITSMALKEMRLLLYTLHPQTMLDREGLIGSINRYMEKMEIQGKMKTVFKVDSIIDLPPDVEYELFRIVQESLNNVIKHAGATKLLVSIKNARDYVELQINDNGVGFDLSAMQEKKGLGITLMRERANNIKSFFSITSKPNEGTKVTIRVNTKHFKSF